MRLLPSPSRAPSSLPRLCVAVGVGAASLLGADGPANARAGTPNEACDARCVVVEVVVAREEAFARQLSLTGAIAPKYQTNVAFRTGGRIAQRLVEIGEHVGADQVLAVLDPRDQTAAVDTAKAALASAQALLVQAKVAFERQQVLLKSGYTTRPSFDAAQQQLRTQQAAVDSATAALGTVREQFGYTELKAGAAGTVVGRNAEAGQVVQAGQTVFALAQDGPRDAVFDVYEAALTEPPASRTVTVALQSDPSVVTQGTVREIAPSVDDKSGAVRVKVELDHVPAGMSLGAAVIGSGSFKPQRGIVLPRGALYRWDDAPAVWIYDPASRTVAPRVVSVTRYDDDRLILSGGVVPGERVVTAGIQFLHPGQVVGVAVGQGAVDQEVDQGITDRAVVDREAAR